MFCKQHQHAYMHVCTQCVTAAALKALPRPTTYQDNEPDDDSTLIVKYLALAASFAVLSYAVYVVVT